MDMRVVMPKLGWFSGAGEETCFEVGCIYDLFDVLRRKPGLFIGGPSITALRSFVDGFCTGLYSVGLRLGDEAPSFGDFHDWIAARHDLAESTMGWKNILLQAAAGQEDAALARFFEELDEFRLDRVDVVRQAEASPGRVLRRRTAGGNEEEVPVQAFELERYLRAPLVYVVEVLPGERWRTGSFRSAEDALASAECLHGVRGDAWA